MVSCRRKIIFLRILILGCVLFSLQCWLLKEKLFRNRAMAVNNSWMKYSNNRNSFKLKLILFYTPLFDRTPWPGIANDYNFTHWRRVPCGVQACRITYERSHFLKSDVVIFHGRDMPDIQHMNRLLDTKPHQQRWVYFTHESPKFTFYDPSLFDGFFNWTMSYRRESDFFVPYRTYAKVDFKDLEDESYSDDYSIGKDRLVVWLVSHCGGLRETFVRKLMKHIKVDVFGSCSPRFNQTKLCPKSSRDCHNTLKRYKFILALENSYCDDYITEKYWYMPFEHNNVPVVMGGSNYDDKIAIPGSFINVLDFRSVESLAEHLIFLHNNNTAYNECFSWKRRYTAVLPESWTCQLCAAANNDSMPIKTYNNMGDLFGEKSACEEHEKTVHNFIEL